MIEGVHVEIPRCRYTIYFAAVPLQLFDQDIPGTFHNSRHEDPVPPATDDEEEEDDVGAAGLY